jgi:polyisoprenoid-binding protein YceI
VAGIFTDWGGGLRANPESLDGGSASVTLLMAGISALHPDRDAHRRTPGAFRGGLILRWIHRGRTPKDPWGGVRIAFGAASSLNRQDFGVALHQPVEGLPAIGKKWISPSPARAVRQQDCGRRRP